MADSGKDSTWYSNLVSFLSARFAVGIVVLVPVAITIVILQFVFSFLDDFLGPGIESLAGRSLPGVGLLALVLLIFSAGLFAMSRFIRWASTQIARIVMTLPGIRVIYGVGKKMTDSFSGRGNGEGFGRVVIAEYPRDLVWSLGFLTGFTRLDMRSFTSPLHPCPTQGGSP